MRSMGVKCFGVTAGERRPSVNSRASLVFPFSFPLFFMFFCLSSFFCFL